MQQEKIWDYFQNEGLRHAAFADVTQRLIIRQLKPGQAVLNIGMGSGALERLAVSRGVNIHVVDPNERSIARLRSELDLGDRAKAGFAQRIPFDDNRFETVVMSEVLEHLDGDTLAASLKEVLRVLRPGGLLWVSVPYREDLNKVMVACPKCGETFHRFGHVGSFDRDKLQRILTDRGYEIEKLYVTAFVTWRRLGIRSLWMSLARVILAKMGESLADPHLIAHARRPMKSTNRI